MAMSEVSKQYFIALDNVAQRLRVAKCYQ